MGSYQDVWNTYLNVWKHKYSLFTGRASREEYWIFTLINVLAYSVLTRGFILGSILAFATFIPSVALGIRRMHDTNRSGWVCLLSLIPFVGWAALLVFACQEGTRGDNQYGPDPLQAQPVAAIPAA
ncbi:MAG TPA: DUF805 domain-containing protein [Myxococcales bacterium]|jgi:uncharacterized membrane protein YhaH (DUF805 family)